MYPSGRRLEEHVYKCIDIKRWFWVFGGNIQVLSMR